MIEELRTFVESYSPNGLSTRLPHLTELYQWVLAASAELPPGCKLSERIFVALNGYNQTVCDKGERKQFNSIIKGYRFCSTTCFCAKEAKSRAASLRHATSTDEQKAATAAKIRDTCISRYGTMSPLSAESVKEKIKQTNLDRYGHTSATKALSVIEKTKNTNQERYGADTPFESEVIRQKAHDTSVVRYGTDTMKKARDDYARQSGYTNPFLNPEVVLKAKDSMIERHGYEKALSNPKIQNAMEERNLEKWGTRFIAQTQHTKDLFRKKSIEKYGRISPNQAHFSDETYAIVNDANAFRTMIENTSLRETAIALKIGYDTARKYCQRHNIDLPRSTYEIALSTFLTDLGIDHQRGNRSLIAPYEVDIFISQRNLAIEFCGLYWHGDLIKSDSRYHLDKLERVEATGNRLITIFEDEWISKNNITKKRLMNALGIGERGVGARQLLIGEISGREAHAFFEMHHIQGGGSYTKHNYGAYMGSELVGAMTFNHPRIALGGRTKDSFELVRFATDGRLFAGLGSRMFARFIKDHNPSRVISYADRRWTDAGNFYSKLGFDHKGNTGQNYWYVNPNVVAREHRFRFRKDRIIDMVPDGKSKTEKQIMIELGYYRIWDCGSMRFEWSRPQ